MEYIDTDSPLRLGRITDAAGQIADVVPRLEAGEGFQLEKGGRVVGALISEADLKLYLCLLREYEDKVDGEAADRAKAEGGERIPWEKLKVELGL